MAGKKKTTLQEVKEQAEVIGGAVEKITKKLLEGAITKGLPKLNKALKDATAKLHDWVEEE